MQTQKPTEGPISLIFKILNGSIALTWNFRD